MQFKGDPYSILFVRLPPALLSLFSSLLEKRMQIDPAKNSKQQYPNETTQTRAYLKKKEKLKINFHSTELYIIIKLCSL